MIVAVHRYTVYGRKEGGDATINFHRAADSVRFLWRGWLGCLVAGRSPTIISLWPGADEGATAVLLKLLDLLRVPEAGR